MILSLNPPQVPAAVNTGRNSHKRTRRPPRYSSAGPHISFASPQTSFSSPQSLQWEVKNDSPRAATIRS